MTQYCIDQSCEVYLEIFGYICWFYQAFHVAKYFSLQTNKFLFQSSIISISQCRHRCLVFLNLSECKLSMSVSRRHCRSERQNRLSSSFNFSPLKAGLSTALFRIPNRPVISKQVTNVDRLATFRIRFRTDFAREIFDSLQSQFSPSNKFNDTFSIYFILSINFLLSSTILSLSILPNNFDYYFPSFLNFNSSFNPSLNITCFHFTSSWLSDLPPQLLTLLL
jgi:hypothetical protein